MQQTRKKMIAIAVPTMADTDWNFVQALRQEGDAKGYQTLVPHFTIFTTVSNVSQHTFSQLLTQHFSTYKKFSFALRTALFMPPLNNHKSWYAFLVPDEGFSQLSLLHRELTQSDLRCELAETFPYIPHITVGSFADKAHCIQFVNKINDRAFSLLGCIDKIILAESIDNTVHVFDEIKLIG